MGCSSSEPKLVQLTVSDFSIQRQAICDKCEFNSSGVCTSVAAKYGSSKAVIENGVRRKDVACPKGKWGFIKETCPACERVSQVLNASLGICKWCVYKYSDNGVLKPTIPRSVRLAIRQDDRNHRVINRPFSGEPVRHLHYFLYPRFEEQTAYHLDQIRRSIDVFNGKRVICVATDRHTFHEKFDSEIRELFTDVRHVPNNPIRRELAGFVDSLRLLETRDFDHAICFAHGKGQQRHTHDNEIIKKWSDVMYETCVRNWDQVREAFDEGYPISGVFKSVGAFRSTRYRWHYSGSFWWARAAKLFSNPFWQQTCRSWWGSESYVGRHWKSTQGHCLFGDGTGNASLYKAEAWKRLEIELEQWRESQATKA